MPYLGGSVAFLSSPCVFMCVCAQVGDFAILLRAGFDRWSAARMQLSTALVGVVGASTALCCQSPQSAGERDHLHMTVHGLFMDVCMPFHFMLHV